MTRKVALTLLRVAGYHGDKSLWLRAHIEGHVSLAVADKEWAAGRQARTAGMRCDCVECRGEP